MLSVAGPGLGQPLLDQPFFNALSVSVIHVEKQAITIPGPWSGFHPNFLTRQATKAAAGFGITPFISFRRVDAKEAYPTGGTVEGIAVNNPGHPYSRTFFTTQYGPAFLFSPPAEQVEASLHHPSQRC